MPHFIVAENGIFQNKIGQKIHLLGKGVLIYIYL